METPRVYLLIGDWCPGAATGKAAAALFFKLARTVS